MMQPGLRDGLVVYLCLLVLCVDLATSCLGKTFLFTVATEDRFRLMGKASIFTYHEEVKINRMDTFFLEWHTAPLTFSVEDSITLHRHKKIDIEVRFNKTMYEKFRGLTQYVRLEGDKEFGVNMMVTGSSTIAVATILPFEYYGTEYRPYFLKFSQILLIALDVPPNVFAGVSLTYFRANKLSSHSDSLSHDSRRYPLPYMCSDMEQYIQYQGRLVDTAAGELNSIKRGKMSILAGNCWTGNRLNRMNCTDKEVKDGVLDSPLATRFAAKEFIVFKGTLNKPEMTYAVMIRITYNNTDVFIHTSGSEPLILTLNDTHRTQKAYLSESFQFINSTLAIQVYLVFSSPCYEGEIGGPALTSIIPNVLFNSQYMWSLPYTDDSITKHNYIVLMKRAGVDYDFIYNGNPKYHSRWIWSAVAGTTQWLVSEIEMVIDSTEVYTLSSSANIGFGCYLYGIESERAYLNYAGFLNAPVYHENTRDNPYNCTSTEVEMEVGDLIDNDCDGKVDEESSMSSDDDDDGKMGEDVMAPVPKFFDRDYKEIITTPALDGNVTLTTHKMTTMTPWQVTWVMTTEPPKAEFNYLLLIILILFLVASALILYYLLRQKRPSPSLVGEYYMTKEERDARSLRRSMELTRTDSKDRHWKSPYSAPGRTVSTYLH